MFLKSEIKKIKKGFYPSRTGKSETAIVGRGDLVGNRRERRLGLTENNTSRNKSKMVVIGTNRFLIFDQPIRVGNGVKYISHMINISKPNC